MLLNLTDIVTSEGKTEEKKISYEKDVFGGIHGNFHIKEKSQIVLKLQNEGKGKVLVEGSFDLTLEMNCNRCLKEVAVPIHVSISELITEENMESPTSADEFPFLNGYQLDVDEMIGNEILINLPMKVLCDENCKGICKKCGTDLNLGECDCDTFVPDPRMAVLKDIFNANKEV